MKIIKLLKNPNTFLQEKARKIADKKIRQQNLIPITETNEDDIFIAGYPKSGNTWMQHLISSILLESTSQRLTPRLVNEIVPDVHAKQYYRRFLPEMFFKTHNLPKPQYKKVIHLIRDGRDAIVSYYKMEVNQNKNYRFSLEDMVIDGKGIFPSKWHIHTRQWMENPFNAKILTVRYEDLKLQPLFELQKICNFANIQLSKDLLFQIITANNINKLREKINIYGTDNEHNYKNKPVTSFFRKGIIGDYKSILNRSQIENFNKEAHTELKAFNYVD